MVRRKAKSLKLLEYLLIALVVIILFPVVTKADEYPYPVTGTFETEEEWVEFNRSLYRMLNMAINPEKAVFSADKVYSAYDEEMRAKALEVTKDCVTDRDKILAVARYVASSTYYSKLLRPEGAIVTSDTAYNTFVNHTAKCSGYSTLSERMLKLINIPCFSIFSNDHQFNAAYDYDENRWIVFDSTWMSLNRFYIDEAGKEVWYKDDYWFKECFDITPEYISTLTSHGMSKFNIDIEYGGVTYDFYIVYRTDSGHTNPNNYWTLTSVFYTFGKNQEGKETIIVPASLGGFNAFYVDTQVARDNPYVKDAIIYTEFLGSMGTFFVDCPNLETIVIMPSNNEKTIDGVSGCPKLKSITIPANIVGIGDNAFDCVENKNDFIIYCDAGSYAESYAITHGYKHAPVPVLNGVNKDLDGILRYYVNNEVATNFTDIALYENEWIYFRNGIQNSEYTGMVKHNNDWWYVSNGKLDKNYVGLTLYGNYAYSVKNGKLDNTASGLTYCKEDSNWYYIKSGRQANTYTGLVWYQNTWWYVTNGKLDKKYVGYTTFDNCVYAIKDGKINSNVNGLTYCVNDWYYLKNGRQQKVYTGLVWYGNTWWYVTDGKLDKAYKGLTKYNDTWYYVSGGKLDKAYAGLTVYNYCAYAIKDGKLNSVPSGLTYCSEDASWYYLKSGKQDKTYTGLVPYNGKLWYVKYGRLDKSFVGNVTYNGATYNVKNGVGIKL